MEKSERHTKNQHLRAEEEEEEKRLFRDLCTLPNEKGNAMTSAVDVSTVTAALEKRRDFILKNLE